MIGLALMEKQNLALCFCVCVRVIMVMSVLHFMEFMCTKGRRTSGRCVVCTQHCAERIQPLSKAPYRRE